MTLATKYSTCEQFKKKMLQTAINEELKTSLAKNFRVLPLYEKTIADHNFSRSHSLNDNQFLYCRWQEYLRIHLAGKPEPFNFPHVNDYHFYNYDTCYKPDLSIRSKTDYRYKLRMGPGVDKYGEVPIPSDVGCRNLGVIVHKNKATNKTIRIQKKKK